MVTVAINPISFNDPLGLSRRGKGFPDDKEADDDLPEVVVRAKKKSTLAERAFGWAKYNRKEADIEMKLRISYYRERSNGKPAGDNKIWDNLYRIEQENRTMQKWVAGILSAPFVAVALSETGLLYGSGQLASYSGRALMRLGQWAFTSPAQLGVSNLMGGVADASFQLVANNGDLNQVNWASVGFNTLAKGGLIKSSLIAGLGSSSVNLTLGNAPTISNPISVKGAFNISGNLAGSFLGRAFGADLPLGRTIGGAAFYNYVSNFGGNAVGNLPETIQVTKQ